MSVYVHGKTPYWYVCEFCGERNVRLYRSYMSSCVTLACAHCAEREQNKRREKDRPHAIGWRIPAVPFADDANRKDATWWGYSAVPQDGVEWWDSLASNHHSASEALVPREASRRAA